MPEYLSKVTYAVLGGSDEYNIPFSFLTSAHVKVKQGSGENIMATSDYSVSGDTLTITGAYEVPVTIYRETPGSTSATKKTPDNQYVDFKNGSVITESDLDNSTLQAIYVSQEAMDKALDAEATPGESGNMPIPTSGQGNNMLIANALGSSAWETVGEVQSNLNVSEAIAPTTIPIRDSSSKIFSNVVGALTGTATEATKLEDARDFNTSGDVSCASAISFDGTANATLATTVEGIQGVDVSDNTPSEGQLLQYKSASSSWVPTRLGLAIFVVKASGLEPGQNITQNGETHEVKLNFDYGKDIGLTPIGTDGEFCELDTATGLITLKYGLFRFEWYTNFTSVGSGYSALISSTTTSTSTPASPTGGTALLLDENTTTSGLATVADDDGQPLNAVAHGWGRVDATSDDKYAQIQVYVQTAGWLGRSEATPPWDFFHTSVIIHRE